MSSMMSKNLCLSDAHPLIAAVDPVHINFATLNKDYDASDPGKAKLKNAVFLARPVEVLILNGCQRVYAARSSFRQLSVTLTKLCDGITELEQKLLNKSPTSSRSRIMAQLENARNNREIVKKALRAVKFWPVRFYHKGRGCLR